MPAEGERLLLMLVGEGLLANQAGRARLRISRGASACACVRESTRQTPA